MSEKDSLVRVEIGKDGAPIVKISARRPKAPQKTRQGSPEIARITSPEYRGIEISKTVSVSTIKAEVLATEESLNIALNAVKWKGYNVEQIVNVMYQLCELITGKTYHPYQSPFIKRCFRSLLLNDGDTLTGLWSRQTGKSECVAGVGVTCAVVLPALAKVFPKQLDIYKDGFRMGIFAPTEEQSKFIYQRILKYSRGQAAVSLYEDPDFQLRLSRYGCSWSNGSSVVAQSANPKSSIDGRDLHMAVHDEAQDAHGYICSGNIEPMLSWVNGTMIYTGRSLDKPCYFYDTIQRNRQIDAVREKTNAELQTHFEYNYLTVSKYNPRYEKYVRQQIRKLGVNSISFKTMYALTWPFEEGMAVSAKVLKEYTMFTPASIHQYMNDSIIVASIDLGSRNNSSVVTVSRIINITQIFGDANSEERKENVPTVQVLNWLALKNMKYPDQRPLMYSFLKMYKDIRLVLVDSTGLGDAVLSEMTNEWPDMPLEGFVFSAKSKSYLMTLFYEYLWSRRILIPNDDSARITEMWQNFFLQTTNLQKVTKSGYTYLSKLDRESAHDDFPDSLMLNLEAAHRVVNRTHEVEVIDNASTFGPTTFGQGGHATGIEAYRKAVREGAGVAENMKQIRAQKLIHGMLSK